MVRQEKLIERDCCRLYEQKRRGERLSKEERPAPTSKAAPHVTARINRGTHLLGLLSNNRITSSHESLNDHDDFASVTNEDITGKGFAILQTSLQYCSSVVSGFYFCA